MWLVKVCNIREWRVEGGGAGVVCLVQVRRSAM